MSEEQVTTDGVGRSKVTVTEIYAHFAPAYDEDSEKLSLISPAIKC